MNRIAAAGRSSLPPLRRRRREPRGGLSPGRRRGQSVRVSGESAAGPSPVEERLIEAVTRGELLDLAHDEPVDETAMRSWGPSRTIRAWVVRDIVRGRLVTDPDPRGLRLRGACVAGLMDLENVTSELNVQLRDCFLPGGLLLRDARLLRLGLTGCRIEQPADSAGPASAHRHRLVPPDPGLGPRRPIHRRVHRRRPQDLT